MNFQIINTIAGRTRNTYTRVGGLRKKGNGKGAEKERKEGEGHGLGSGTSIKAKGGSPVVGLKMG